jgi:hypothetical protein
VNLGEFIGIDQVVGTDKATVGNNLGSLELLFAKFGSADAV